MKKFEYKIESMKRTPELDPSGKAGAIASDSTTFTADDAPEEILKTLDMHVKFVQVNYWNEGEYQPYSAYTRQSLKWIRITYGLFETSTEVH
ncbi:MAG: hypothetical protein H7222_00770 [Methylotenera sp.]|nr:hypothetical protein [Oligoflexia bacterium]